MHAHIYAYAIHTPPFLPPALRPILQSTPTYLAPKPSGLHASLLLTCSHRPLSHRLPSTTWATLVYLLIIILTFCETSNRSDARTGCTPEDGDGAPAQHSASLTQLLSDLHVRRDGTSLSANAAASRSMLRASPEEGASASAPRVHHSLSLTGLSSTTSSCWWAALASIVAAPVLLWRTPSCHPVGETRIAIVGRAGGADRSATGGGLPWAALSMHPATPTFLTHRPTGLPVGKTISAIVWIGGRSRRNRHRRWHHWHRHRWWSNGHRHRRWSNGPRAPNVVDSAAPRLLVCLPTLWRIHCAIVRVHRTAWPNWLWSWLFHWRCWRRCWWRCWWRRWLWSGRSPAGSEASHS